MILHGQIWWADLDLPIGSAPGYRRPVLVVSSDRFNRSRIATVVAVVVTTDLRLAGAPGNVRLPTHVSGLVEDSVLNVSQIVTLDRTQLTDRVGDADADTLRQVDAGLRLVLGLD